MFLIYNFHLYEQRYSEYTEEYMQKIRRRLMREIDQDSTYYISIYGAEAFYCSSLKSIDRNHLLEAWRKMNRLWTFFLSYEHKDTLSLPEEMHLEALQNSLRQGAYYKAATSIDHLIKVYEGQVGVGRASLWYFKEIFPYMIRAVLDGSGQIN